MKKKFMLLSCCLLAAFALWTAAVTRVDVQAIGPAGSSVGFAGLNGFVHRCTGVHMALYHMTDRLSLIPLMIVMGFALMGLRQWIRRRSLRSVDPDILALGGFYLLTGAAFAFFEAFVVNYRPVLIEGILEASYPSSTTMLVICVMSTAAMQGKNRIRNANLRSGTMLLIHGFTVFMVLGRLLSGVHWLTDILGGILLSSGLVALYASVTSSENKKRDC